MTLYDLGAGLRSLSANLISLVLIAVLAPSGVLLLFVSSLERASPHLRPWGLGSGAFCCCLPSSLSLTRTHTVCQSAGVSIPTCLSLPVYTEGPRIVWP